MTSPNRLAQIVLLFALVIGGGWLWWSLRSERMAAPQQAALQTSLQGLKAVSVDTLTFQAQSAEIETTTRNYPDHALLPDTCQPVQNLFSYSGAAEAQYESIFTWDTTQLQTSDTEKQALFNSYEQSLQALTSLADSNTHRLPLRGEWDAQALFPWNDPDCGVGETYFYPILIEEISLSGYEKAWYLESLEGFGIPELPVQRRVFARQGTRWIVVSEQQSAEKELQLPFETVYEELAEACDTKNASLPDIITCEAQYWFSKYRLPEVAQRWTENVASRISR